MSGAVGSRPSLIRKRLAARELVRDLALDDELVGAALEDGELMGDVDGMAGSSGRGAWHNLLI